MDKTQFEREKQYGAAAAVAKQLLHRKLITPAEHQKLMAVLIQKYQPAATFSPGLSRKAAKEGVLSEGSHRNSDVAGWLNQGGGHVAHPENP